MPDPAWAQAEGAKRSMSPIQAIEGSIQATRSKFQRSEHELMMERRGVKLIDSVTLSAEMVADRVNEVDDHLKDIAGCPSLVFACQTFKDMAEAVKHISSDLIVLRVENRLTLSAQNVRGYKDLHLVVRVAGTPIPMVVVYGLTKLINLK